MGYMGLDSVLDSDAAADFVFGDVIPALVKQLRKGLKEKGNTYNTSGIENVAMFLVEFVLPASDSWKCEESLVNFVNEELLPKLGELIQSSTEADWDSGKNKRMHLDHYLSWQTQLEEFVKASQF